MQDYAAGKRPQRLMRGLSVTTTFDDRQRTVHTGGRLPSIGRWLGDHWPKAAIAFGFALTIVWTAVLAWLIAVVVGLL
jgi:hypothetical protein